LVAGPGCGGGGGGGGGAGGRQPRAAAAGTQTGAPTAGPSQTEAARTQGGQY